MKSLPDLPDDTLMIISDYLDSASQLQLRLVYKKSHKIISIPCNEDDLQLRMQKLLYPIERDFPEDISNLLKLRNIYKQLHFAQPGTILDEIGVITESYGIQFEPNVSTVLPLSNRSRSLIMAPLLCIAAPISGAALIAALSLYVYFFWSKSNNNYALGFFGLFFLTISLPVTLIVLAYHYSQYSNPNIVALDLSLLASTKQLLEKTINKIEKDTLLKLHLDRLIKWSTLLSLNTYELQDNVRAFNETRFFADFDNYVQAMASQINITSVKLQKDNFKKISDNRSINTDSDLNNLNQDEIIISPSSSAQYFTHKLDELRDPKSNMYSFFKRAQTFRHTQAPQTYSIKRSLQHFFSSSATNFIEAQDENFIEQNISFPDETTPLRKYN